MVAVSDYYGLIKSAGTTCRPASRWLCVRSEDAAWEGPDFYSLALRTLLTLKIYILQFVLPPRRFGQTKLEKYNHLRRFLQTRIGKWGVSRGGSVRQASRSPPFMLVDPAIATPVIIVLRNNP